MKLDITPTLDSRTASDFMDALLALQRAWTPELVPAKGEPAYALMQIFARFMQSSVDRLNQAPDKNLLAFLDTFGIALIPPQPARAPVVFTPVPNAADATIPARTRLSAKVAGLPAPLIFETEQDGAMAAARLTDVVTVWPAQDRYADHSGNAAGKRQFKLFDPLSPVPHELYLAHDSILSFSGSPRIDIEFELAPGGTTPIFVKWDFWDGQAWRPFRDINPLDPSSGSDGTLGFTRSGIVSLRAGCGTSQPTTVYGVKAHWIRARLAAPIAPAAGRVWPQVFRVRLRSVISGTDMAPFPPDAAYAGSTKLDVSKVFYPFDQSPTTGSTFYLSADSALGKPGANVVIDANDVTTALESNLSPGSTTIVPILVLEYWNGTAWTNSGLDTSLLYNFIKNGSSLQFQVPADIAKTTVNNQTTWWIRLRIQNYNFAASKQVTFKTDATDPTQTDQITMLTTVPPALEKLTIVYSYQAPWTFPEHCVTFNDFQWADHSRDVRWPGHQFPAFSPVSDATPSLYFGFDKPLPNDYVSLYLDIEEAPAEGPPLVWEAWNGDTWEEISLQDETGKLSRPGMISFVPPLVTRRASANITAAAAALVSTGNPLDAALFKPADRVLIEQPPQRELRQVINVEGVTITLDAPLEKTYAGGSITIAALPRFGQSRDWVRARLKDDGLPAQPDVNGVYLNALWTRQVETVTQEILGGGLGIPNQSFFLNKAPLLPGEQIEVRELDGLRANVEYPILKEELTDLGYSSDEIVTAADPRTNRITEVWVLWQERPHFYFSGPDDRHYVVERTSSRILFGDGINGKMPPVGSGNIRARMYQAGGGLAGNVAPGQINQIMSGVLANRVTNPRAGEGGADAETPVQILSRGPNVFRHQERSMSAPDYEALAREASPAIAAVRVLPVTAGNGRPAAGSVTVVIVPHSQDPQPQPSFELRQEVHDFLTLRAPCTVDPEDITIKGPFYLPVGISGILVPNEISQAGAIGAAATAAMTAFLHPLTGGPDGTGWAFGRGVFISDVAAILEAIPAVDHAEFLELRLNDTPVGDSVTVPPDRMVVAGPIRIEVRGA
jgi:hypothetical protein